MARPSADAEHTRAAVANPYQAAHRAWRLNARPDLEQLTRVEEVAGLLAWAIRNEQPGFACGELIGVAEAARCLESSRATVGLAIERLRAEKLVQSSGPRAPYRILRYDELGPSQDELTQERISITASVGGPVHIWPAELVRADERRGRPGLSGVLEALHHSPDPAVQRAMESEDSEAMRRWRDGPVLVFRRLRCGQDTSSQQAWLVETTAVALPDAQLVELAAVVDGGLTDLSLSHVLEVIGVSGLRSGRTRVLIDRVPDPVRDMLVAASPKLGLDLSLFLGPNAAADGASRPWLLRWEYAFFAADPSGLVSYSVCHVLPGGPVEIYCRSLTFESPSAQGD